MIFWLFIITAVLAALYLYLTWNFDYWKKQGIPGPKGTRILLGDLPNGLTRKKHLYFDFEQIYNEFKGKTPFVGIIETKTPRLLILEPELVKDVMIRKFNSFRNSEFTDMIDPEQDPLFAKNPFFLKDEEWKEKRAEITPAFTNNRLKALYPLAENVLDRMIKYVQNQDALDARELAAKFTVDVVSNSIYGIDAGSFETEKPEIREMGRKLFQPSTAMFIKMALIFIFPFLKPFVKVQFSTFETQSFFKNLMKQALEYREKNNVQREDFLDFIINLKKKKHISDLEMASHTISFFTDGFETSSIAIAHTIYELARNKRVQDKLREEVNKHFDENGKISYESLNEIEYLDFVFHEALRMHPPLTLISRRCEEEGVELKFDGKKVKIQKGLSVYIPVQSLHYDSEYYLEPTTFYPERFEDGGLKSYRDRCVLLPFGDGPRICLGMRFALMQSKLAIAGLVRKFELTVNEKTSNPLIMDPKEFLNIKLGGLWINFKPIKK